MRKGLAALRGLAAGNKLALRPHAAVAAATLALVLAACGSGGGDTTESIASTAPACAHEAQGVDDVCFDPANADAKRIVNAVRKIKQRDDLPAVMLGVWVDGKELVTAAMGQAQPGVPATRDLHFRVGNVTESVLTTLLLELVDEGELKLDDPLSKWYPDFPEADKVTLQMLASSTSGYNDFVTTPAFSDAYDENPFQGFTSEQLLKIAASKPPLFPPGKSWAFSDTNFLLLALVIEKVTGEPVAKAMRAKVLDPLGLDNTRAEEQSTFQSPVLHAYLQDQGVYGESTFWNISWAAKFADLTSNVFDLGRWAQALGTGDLLSASSHEKQVGPGNVGIGPLAPERYYGFGIPVFNGWEVANPQLLGYNGVLGYEPKAKVAVVAFTTLGHESDPATTYSVLILNAIARVLTPDSIPGLPAKPRG